MREGLADGAERCRAAALIASTLPDLLDGDAARELAARGIPAVAGLATALACVQALRRAPGDPGRMRGDRRGGHPGSRRVERSLGRVAG